MEQELQSLRTQVNELKKVTDMIVYPDRYVFERPISGGASGLKVGVTNSRLAFYGNLPIIQPTPTGETSGMTSPGGFNATNQSTFTGNYGSTAHTLSDVVKALKQLGLLKL